MKLPSLTVVASGIFIAYITHSVWTIRKFVFPPEMYREKELRFSSSKILKFVTGISYIDVKNITILT